MKSKLTFVAATIAALVFVSSAVFASSTRMASMGLTGVEPMIQKDSTQWTWNPATITQFSPLLTVYWDQASNTAGGGKLLLKPVKNLDLYTLISADYNSDAFKGVTSAGDPAWNNMWNFGANTSWDVGAFLTAPTNAGLTNDYLADGAVDDNYLYDPATMNSATRGLIPLFFQQNLDARTQSDIAQNPFAAPPGTVLLAAQQLSTALSPLVAAQNIGSAVPPQLAVMMATATIAYKIKSMSYGVEGSFGYTESNDNSNLEWKVKAGAAVSITSSMSIDAAFCFGMPMMDASGKTTTVTAFGASTNSYTYKTDGAYDLYAYARFNWQVAETQNLHVYVRYDDADHTTFYEDDLESELKFMRRQHRLQFGVSDEMNFTKTSLVYVGINVIMDQHQYNYDGDFGGTAAYKLSGDTTSWYMTLNMGCDAQLIGGLSGRMGVVHDIMLYNEDNNADTEVAGSTSTYSYRTSASIGLAYKIGDLLIEGTVNKALFTSGPYFISGNSLAGGLSSSIALTYFFGQAPAAPAATNEEK